MHSSHHSEQPARPARPAADAPTRDSVADLRDRTRRLREDAAALCRAEPEDLGDHGARRAAWDQAVRRLDDAGEQLARLTGPDRPPAVTAPHATGVGAGLVGSAEWSLLTDGVVWSDGLYGLFGLSRGDGPLTLDELPSYLLEEDRPALTSALTGCLVDGRAVCGEFRIHRPDGGWCTVRLTAEPVLDDSGGTVAMWAVLREVSGTPAAGTTGRETADEPADATESEAVRTGTGEHGAGFPPPRRPPPASVGLPVPTDGDVPRSGTRPRRPTHSTHRLVTDLAEAGPELWVGPAERPARPGGPGTLDLAAACVPAASPAAAEGKWHDWLDLPDGDTLLSVGDLSGRGAAAAAGTATTLGALRGITLTGAPPARVLGHLNDLLDHGDRPALASAVCARYRPSDAGLTWAQAGHPAPLLCRGGVGRTLPRPAGTLLGAATDSVYGERRDRLERGDTLVLVTDGLFSGGGGGRVGANGRTTDPRLLALAPTVSEAPTAREALEVVLAACRGGERPGDACVLVARVG